MSSKRVFSMLLFDSIDVSFQLFAAD